MRKAASIIAGAIVVSFLTFGGGAAAQAALPAGYTASCTTISGGGRVVSTKNWTNNKAVNYGGVYNLRQNGRVVFTATPSDRAWQNIRASYRNAQVWCNQNSLTCTILTTAASTLIAPILAAARS